MVEVSKAGDTFRHMSSGQFTDGPNDRVFEC